MLQNGRQHVENVTFEGHNCYGCFIWVDVTNYIVLNVRTVITGTIRKRNVVPMTKAQKDESQHPACCGRAYLVAIDKFMMSLSCFVNNVKCHSVPGP